jgi:hypothetical protein
MTAPGNYGINTRGDVLVNQTADGVDVNAIWQDLIDAFQIWNQERSLNEQRNVSSLNLCFFDGGTLLGLESPRRSQQGLTSLGWASSFG